MMKNLAGRPDIKDGKHFKRLTSNVEPAVNRQPGFRRGAVEQSAFNNTHTSKKNLYVLFFRTDGRDGQTGGRMHG